MALKVRVVVVETGRTKLLVVSLVTKQAGARVKVIEKVNTIVDAPVPVAVTLPAESFEPVLSVAFPAIPGVPPL